MWCLAPGGPGSANAQRQRSGGTSLELPVLEATRTAESARTEPEGDECSEQAPPGPGREFIVLPLSASVTRTVIDLNKGPPAVVGHALRSDRLRP